MKRIAVLGVALLALATGATAAAKPGATRYARNYVDEMWMGNTLEAKGIYYHGHKVAVDSALCLGLRRYGVRTSEFDLDRYWRFKCDVNGADEHLYTVQVSTTAGPKRGYVYWHFLSVRQEF